MFVTFQLCLSQIMHFGPLEFVIITDDCSCNAEEFPLYCARLDPKANVCLSNSLTLLFNRFGSIVYNRSIVFKRQKFLKVVIHVIIIDQCNQNAR